MTVTVGQVWKRGKEERTVLAVNDLLVEASCVNNPQRDYVRCLWWQWRKWAAKATHVR